MPYIIRTHFQAKDDRMPSEKVQNSEQTLKLYEHYKKAEHL